MHHQRKAEILRFNKNKNTNQNTTNHSGGVSSDSTLPNHESGHVVQNAVKTSNAESQCSSPPGWRKLKDLQEESKAVYAKFLTEDVK